MPLRAGVSSLGVGGTNAHVVLEEAPARPPSGERPRPPAPRDLGAHGDGPRGGDGAPRAAPARARSPRPGGRGPHAAARPPPLRAPPLRGRLVGRGRGRSARGAGPAPRLHRLLALERAAGGLHVPGPGGPVRRDDPRALRVRGDVPAGGGRELREAARTSRAGPPRAPLPAGGGGGGRGPGPPADVDHAAGPVRGRARARPAVDELGGRALGHDRPQRRGVRRGDARRRPRPRRRARSRRGARAAHAVHAGRLDAGGFPVAGGDRAPAARRGRPRRRQRPRLVRGLRPHPGRGRDRERARPPGRARGSAPHVARLPLADDGRRPRPLPGAPERRRPRAAPDPVRLEPHRDLDHRRGGHEPRVLGRSPAPRGALRRRPPAAAGGARPRPPGGRPRPHPHHAGPGPGPAARSHRRGLGAPPAGGGEGPPVPARGPRPPVARGRAGRRRAPLRRRAPAARRAADLSVRARALLGRHGGRSVGAGPFRLGEEGSRGLVLPAHVEGRPARGDRRLRGERGGRRRGMALALRRVRPGRAPGRLAASPGRGRDLGPPRLGLLGQLPRRVRDRPRSAPRLRPAAARPGRPGPHHRPDRPRLLGGHPAGGRAHGRGDLARAGERVLQPPPTRAGPGRREVDAAPAAQGPDHAGAGGARGGRARAGESHPARPPQGPPAGAAQPHLRRDRHRRGVARGPGRLRAPRRAALRRARAGRGPAAGPALRPGVRAGEPAAGGGPPGPPPGARRVLDHGRPRRGRLRARGDPRSRLPGAARAHQPLPHARPGRLVRVARRPRRPRPHEHPHRARAGARGDGRRDRAGDGRRGRRCRHAAGRSRPPRSDSGPSTA